jgi:hypothetical protein
MSAFPTFLGVFSAKTVPGDLPPHTILFSAHVLCARHVILVVATLFLIFSSL